MSNNTQALRYNHSKTKIGLIPPYAREVLAEVLTFGAEKYTPDNWKNGFQWMDVVDSLERHINAFKYGEDYDPESGSLHLGHAMCNLAFLIEFYKIYPQGDNRWQHYHPKIGLDIDEVLADFIGGWMELHGLKERPTSWSFHRDMDKEFQALKDSGKINEFYLGLKPLIDPLDLSFEPECYITSRPVDTEISQQWLDMHGFPVKPVYTVSYGQSKVDAALKAGVEVFIDDCYQNYKDLNKAGIFCYLMDASHNQRYKQVGHRRLHNLSDLQYMKQNV